MQTVPAGTESGPQVGAATAFGIGTINSAKPRHIVIPYRFIVRPPVRSLVLE
jgi:hypothetical protein